MENRDQEPKGGQADVMIANATVVTLNPARDVLREAAVVIQDGRIVAVESEPERIAAWEAKRTIDGTDRVVFPGLVNTHTHMFQTLLKGLGDDLGKKDWVQQMASLSSASCSLRPCNPEEKCAMTSSDVNSWYFIRFSLS